MPPKKKVKIETGQQKLCFQKVENSKEIVKHIIDSILNNVVGLSSSSFPSQSVPGTSSESTTTTHTSQRKVVSAWFKEFPWLTVSDGKMFCIACKDDGIVTNSFVNGCENFRKSALSDHISTKDHKKALLSISNKKDAKDSQNIIFSELELGICTAARLVHTIIHIII